MSKKIIAEQAPVRGRWLPVWRGGLIILLVCLAYWPALRGGFIWDDDTHISANDTLRSWHGLWEIWVRPGATCQYYPLSFTLFWLGHQLWGLNPPGYHLLNVALHSLVALLLWQILERLKVRGAWLAGAMFALHPVCVMSVAWMTELKNVLSAALALGAGWAYLRFARLGVYAATESNDGGPGPGASGIDWRYGVLSLALFWLAMFAKTAVSFLPATLLLIAWWQQERWVWRKTVPLLLMLALVAVMGQVTFFVERLQGAVGAEFKLDWQERVLVSGRSFWFYLGKLFFPYHLTFIYERWNINASAWWQYLYPAVTVGFFATLWRARRVIGKGPFVAMLHFYISTSLLILIVVLYMTRYSFVSDHWQYFGCLSVLALAAAGITRALDELGKWSRFLKPAVVGILLLVLGLLTRNQCGMYADEETLWRDTLARNPDCWMAYNNLGIVLAAKGRRDEAIENYRQAIRINPDFSDALSNLGAVLADKSQFDEAIESYRQAIRVNPKNADALYNLGIALAAKDRWDEAIESYRQALRIHPNNADALYNLGLALAAKKQFDDAIENYRQALRINPNFPKALNNLGMALAAKGQFDEAIENYRQALRINPKFPEALNNLGIALVAKGQLDTAIESYRQALLLRPQSYEALNNLGVALTGKGRFDEAIENYRQALQVNPHYAETYFHWGLALDLMGRPREAVVQYREALRLNPDLAGALNGLAWVLAASSEAEVRNGAEAVRLAQRACELTHEGQPIYLGTLAAAYAEAGRFAEAVTTAEKAEQLATTIGSNKLAERIRRWLDLFRAGKPYHKPGPTGQ